MKSSTWSHVWLATALLLIGTVAGCASPQPEPAPPASGERVFELRTYTAAPGRLPDLHARFREHTMRFFAKHGMTNIGYWVPRDSALAENTVVYLLAHDSREAARQSWRAFGADPEWQAVAAASEASGPLVIDVESVFLDPTDYSQLR